MHCCRIPYYLSYSRQYPGKFLLSYLPRKSTRHEFVTVTPEGIRYRARTFPALASMVRWFKEHFRDPIPGQSLWCLTLCSFLCHLWLYSVMMMLVCVCWCWASVSMWSEPPIRRVWPTVVPAQCRMMSLVAQCRLTSLVAQCRMMSLVCRNGCHLWPKLTKVDRLFLWQLLTPSYISQPNLLYTWTLTT